MQRRAIHAVLLLALCLTAAACWFVAQPLPATLLAYQPVTSLKVLARDGSLLRELNSASDGRGTPIDAAQLSVVVKEAFFAAEDKSFEHHWGLSPSAIARAMWQNVRARKIVSGGSTITQQLARHLVQRERTLFGKVQEALWALRLERHLTKNEILSQYLNRVSFGNNAFGIEAAAQLYFGKKALHLSVGQAALLASLLKSPTVYNPFSRAQKCEARRQWVIDHMLLNGFLTPDLASEARREGALDLVSQERAFLAPHFVELIRQELKRVKLEGVAAVVETTLDPALQAQTERHVFEEVSRLHDRQVSSAAVLVVDNHSDEVLAYVGSANFFDETIGGQNDGIQMKRQPGSALKPFVYAEGFRQGFTPATVLADLETAFDGRKGAYSPKNYDRRLHGPVRAREALANSYNVPAVRVANALGVKATLATLRRAGFESLVENEEHYGLGLALGNGEVSLVELTRAYAGMSHGGEVRALKYIVKATDAEGRVLSMPRHFETRRFADSRSVAQVTHILSDNAARARAFGLDNALRLPFAVAAKTGTSKGYSDNWTVGFTAEKTVAVWAGNFDGTPMVQVSGITGAGPIFRRVMLSAMESVSPQPLVDLTGLERRAICPLSGQRASPNCPAEMSELFVQGQAPKEACQMHRGLSTDLSDSLKQKCLAIQAAQGRLTDLGLEYYDWARNEGLMGEPWLAAACLGRNGEGATETDHVGNEKVKLLHPANGDEFLLLSDLPLSDQSIPLRISAAPSLKTIIVFIDGVKTLELKPPFTGRIAALKGRHELVLQDSNGARLDAVQFLVREESRL
jgi:penicillin-binding protein 1C